MSMSRRAPRLSQFERSLDAALMARSPELFEPHVQQATQALQQQLQAGPLGRSQTLGALETFFSSTTADRRRRRLAELCAWPLFDKPALPRQMGEQPAFLWLFVVPFLVTYAVESLGQAMLPTGARLDVDGILDELETQKLIVAQARLRAFSGTLRRDDLHAYGPRQLARAFVGAELGADASPQGLPLRLDADLDSHRSVLHLLPCAARLPMHATELFTPDAFWQGERANQLMLEGLRAEGFKVDHVTSFAPRTMAQALMTCGEPGRAEIAANLMLARQLYGPLEVSVRMPMPGIAEVVADTPLGPDVLVMAPLAFLEPPRVFTQSLEQVCSALSLSFRGCFELASQSRLHH